MNGSSLLLAVLIPAAVALLVFLIPRNVKVVREGLGIIGALVLFYIAIALFRIKNLEFSIPWVDDGLGFDLRLYHFSSFILIGITGLLLLIIVYSSIQMMNHARIREYYTYVFLTAALANGAVLADNFIVLLFFWEGLLVTLYGLITLGGKEAYKTAVKSFIIVGLTDFCMILGISILWFVTRNLRMSTTHVEPVGLGAVSFILMMIGALGKGGAMPFHTWIPDAAIDAPVSVMAFIPGALEKLLGIYLLTRVSLDFFALKVNSPLCIVMMTIGAATIVLAVLMALIQKDFKKLLSFHAISQFGYMVLGVGTGLPIGIAGGIFHMLNNVIYKCGLFMCAGSVEHRTGTTELKKLGGLRQDMPVTAIGYLVLAAAISGIWPLNGFVSKEMVFHGSFETGFLIFTIAAWVGAIFTFASFLKAGHSIFLGPRSSEIPEVKESESPFLIPILILAALSIIFGVYNVLPLKLFIEPILEGHVSAGEHIEFSSHALSLASPIALISMGCLLIAVGLHFYGWNRGGKKAYLASEPVHKLPVLKILYDWSEARYFDIYEQGVKFLRLLSKGLYYSLDRTFDYFLEKVVTYAGRIFTRLLQYAHNGHYANYLAWCIAGLAAIAWAISALLK
jgi:NADH:ubiquinone oxidoreductase subunit 5 (subunit L)/multisubunit Na+/H+ antiporter MnhA subunit